MNETRFDLWSLSLSALFVAVLGATLFLAQGQLSSPPRTGVVGIDYGANGRIDERVVVVVGESPKPWVAPERLLAARN